MEKQQLPAEDEASFELPRPKRSSSRFRGFVVLVFLVYAVWVLRPSEGTWFPLRIDAPASHDDTACKPFSWSDLKAKPYLDYVSCYDGKFQCARLELPMDYWNGTTNATVGIAVIKKPAVVPVTHPQYGGVTLHNPGGPGGSGVGFLLGAASGLRGFIDSKDGKGKFFDHLSFDPRGIGFTTPRISCFHNFATDLFWAVRLGEQGVFSASDAAFGRLWSMEKARGNSCSLPVPENEIDVKKYASTASVARDMLEIVERHGEWRETEARRLLQRQPHCGKSATKDGESSSEVLERVKYRPGKEKINYWGFSYGSYLGNTFAAMFPSRIERLIVDGVVDAYDYVKALWLDDLVDTEQALDLFFFHCARVGFPTCLLANETGTTTQEGVKQRYLNITNSLYHNPLPVISRRGPEVVTYSDVKGITLGVLYTPIGGFDILADIMYAIEHGDGGMFARIRRGVFASLCQSRVDEDDDDNDEGFDIMGDAQIAIACTDGDSQNWMTKADFADHVKNITKLSPTVGEIWSVLRMRCIHFSVRAYSRFEGPWVGNTSHPILQIGNTADPVTPGRFAKKMARGFPGAVALIQDSAGHCSISTPSKCTMSYVNQYFQTGELPPEDTVCKPDALPFGPTPGDYKTLYDDELETLKGRQQSIANALYASGGGFLNGGFGAGLSAVPELA